MSCAPVFYSALQYGVLFNPSSGTQRKSGRFYFSNVPWSRFLQVQTNSVPALQHTQLEPVVWKSLQYFTPQLIRKAGPTYHRAASCPSHTTPLLVLITQWFAPIITAGNLTKTDVDRLATSCRILIFCSIKSNQNR